MKKKELSVTKRKVAICYKEKRSFSLLKRKGACPTRRKGACRDKKKRSFSR